MPTRLVLFDIDGTLLTTNGRAVQAMLAAVRAVYGVAATWDTQAMNGKTELWIVHKLLADVGIPRSKVEPGLPRMWDAYVRELRERLAPGNITVFPGVRELLRVLAECGDVVVGLLTGNIAASARVKLEVAGLDGFACGAFGEHHRERAALPAVALSEAERLCGEKFAGRAVTIIGDTPNDIACGRHLGVNAIAVATGKFDCEALRAHQPHHLFNDLSDTQAVLAAIGAP